MNQLMKKQTHRIGIVFQKRVTMRFQIDRIPESDTPDRWHETRNPLKGKLTANPDSNSGIPPKTWHVRFDPLYERRGNHNIERCALLDAQSLASIVRYSSSES